MNKKHNKTTLLIMFLLLFAGGGKALAQFVGAPYIIGDQTPTPPSILGNGTLSGRICFDIAESNDNADCGRLAGRAKADFATMGAQIYTFTAETADVSNVRYIIEDPEGCVNTALTPLNGTLISGALTNGNSTTLSVNFKQNLNSSAATPQIRGRNKDAAAQVVINIVYYDNAKDVKVPLTVKIQDCSCCGAYTAPGVWKVFMCHNLGADYSADPFTPAEALHGAKYKWGTGVVALTHAEDAATPGTITGWATKGGTPPTTTADWDMTTKNPCPAGYRVPTQAEWAGVVSTSNNTWTRTTGSWTSSSTNWTAGVQIGDGLFLPAAGYRNFSDGTLLNRGDNGYYWSSTVVSSASAYYMSFGSSGQNATGSSSKSHGFSLRCLAE
ncbi:MAG: hypothetical protein LBN27_04670 [Prevotellaceae bacterium]|nr:hypothetical protein [Prevotellaceae bacterium]